MRHTIIIIFSTMIFTCSPSQILVSENDKQQHLDFIANEKFLLIPIKNGKLNDELIDCTKSKLWLIIDNQKIGPYDIIMPKTVNEVSWYGHFPLENFKGRNVKVVLEGATEEAFSLIWQSNNIPTDTFFYEESLRPQLHFSAKTGWINDPNGLIYYKGEYHMYFQHNPFSLYWGNMSWGHAVSRDLIHWEEKPVVLFPSENGTCFSGACFIDNEKQLNLSKEGEDVLVAFYLKTKIGLAYAYSNDSGYSFSEYERNPVLTKSGARIDTPRPFWHKPTKRWITTTYDFFINKEGEKRRCVGIYSSKDLTDWKYESRVEQDSWGDELCGCVDFFQLPIDGNRQNMKWVMIFIDGSYIVGDFDGHIFYTLSGKPAETRDRITSLVVPGNYYATMTWHNAPNNRRVQIAWMGGAGEFNEDIDFPGMPFNKQMSLPVDLTLHSTTKGPQLRINPIKEFESLRRRTYDYKDFVLQEENPVTNTQGELFELEVEFKPEPGSETIFDMRGIPVRYIADKQLLSCGSVETALSPINDKIRLTIIQDLTSIEIFGNEGRVYIPMIKIPPDDS